MDLLRRLIVVAALAGWAGLASCAHGGRDRGEDRGGDAATSSADGGADADEAADDRDDEASGSAHAPPPPRVVSTDRALASDAGAGTSARAASARVVEEGKGYLIARQPEAAARRFLRATQVDPSNGFAWYYLGRARADAGLTRGAVGVLEKAESLLGPYPAWRNRATRLLTELRAR